MILLHCALTVLCTHGSLVLPPCTVVLPCLYKWPVRWWMLLSPLHNAAVLARRGINVEAPPETHPALYIPATAHAQWPRRDNPNNTSFIIQSLCVSLRERQWEERELFSHWITRELRVLSSLCRESESGTVCWISDMTLGWPHVTWCLTAASEIRDGFYMV